MGGDRDMEVEIWGLKLRGDHRTRLSGRQKGSVLGKTKVLGPVV